jgi:hypothetical protein
MAAAQSAMAATPHAKPGRKPYVPGFDCLIVTVLYPGLDYLICPIFLEIGGHMAAAQKAIAATPPTKPGRKPCSSSRHLEGLEC